MSSNYGIMTEVGNHTGPSKRVPCSITFPVSYLGYQINPIPVLLFEDQIGYFFIKGIKSLSYLSMKIRGSNFKFLMSILL